MSLDGMGNRLAQICALERLNQTEFAHRTGVSPAFASDLLRDNKRPGCEFLTNLRQSLGVSIDWLLTGKGSMYGGEPIELGLFQHIVWQIQLVRAALVEEQVAAIQLLENLQLLKEGKTLPSFESSWHPASDMLKHEDLTLAMVLYNSHLWTRDVNQQIRNIHAAVLAHFQMQKPVCHSQFLERALRMDDSLG